ncbi:MAG: hypothetical protein ABI301_02340 [Jatrophihabitantaceae bacterium]
MGTDERTARGRIGAPGIVFMIGGAIGLLLSFTTFEWYSAPKATGDSVGKITFSELRHNLDRFPAQGRPSASVAYFGGLAWALLIALIIVAFAANLPIRASNGLRLLGLFLGLAGAALTYYTLSRYAQATHDLFGTGSGALDNASLGIWCALGGYLLAGIGAALGPRPPGFDTISP